MMGLSLKRKITFGTLTILSICLVFVGLLSLQGENKRLMNELRTRGDGICSLVAEFCATPIKKFSFYIVQEVARNVEQAKGVAFCEIYDAEGESLVRVDTTIHGTKLVKKPRRLDDDILIVEKWIEQGGTRLGRVEIGLELDPVREELKTHFLGIALSTLAVLLLVGLAVNLFLTRYFISPVVNLSHAVGELARGDFVESGISERNDEIGNLARAFNEMSNNLGQLYRELEDKVDERTADLARANLRLKEEINVRLKTENELLKAKETAEQANRYKSNFVANMSHEIRTPLNAVIGYTQILRNRGNFDEDDRNDLDSIDRAGGHLLGIINDILDLSKIEAGRMEIKPEPMDLCLLLRNMTAMFQFRCSEKSLSWEVVGIDTSEVIPVMADAGKLRQIMINLLGNAVKFTEKGGIVLRVTRDGEFRFRFCIEDTGPGIPHEDHETVFQPFSNMSGESGKEGTGLGLSISQRFLEMMGSNLEIHDNSPQGSRFCFDLQLMPTDAGILPEQEPERIITGIVTQSPLLALIVDDDDLSRNLMVRTLDNIGIRTMEAVNGLEALRSIEKIRPDIVFMDRYMPEMGGIETLQTLQNNYGETAPPVVMVTAAAIDSEREGYDQAGAAGLLLKPCTLSEILECLVAVLNMEPEVATTFDDGEEAALDSMVREPLKIVVSPALRDRLISAAEYGKISELKQLTAEPEFLDAVEPKAIKQFQEYLKSYRLDELVNMLK